MGNLKKDITGQLSIADLLASKDTGGIGRNFSPDQIQELINTLSAAKQTAKQRERNERLKREREERARLKREREQKEKEEREARERKEREEQERKEKHIE